MAVMQQKEKKIESSIKKMAANRARAPSVQREDEKKEEDDEGEEISHPRKRVPKRS